MKKISERFIEGLKNYNLTFDEILNWKYCGGDQKNHLNYFKLYHKISEDQDFSLPLHADKCVCDHPIKENCYITNGKKIIVLGNCCIKKFAVGGKRCKICDTVHKNRKDNYCNSCRKDVAEKEKRKKQAEWYCSCGDRKKNKSHPLCVSCYYRN